MVLSNNDKIMKINAFYVELASQLNSDLWWCMIESSRDRFLSALRMELESRIDISSKNIYDLNHLNINLISLLKLCSRALSTSILIFITKIRLYKKYETEFNKNKISIILKSFHYKNNLQKNYTDPFWETLFSNISKDDRNKILLVSEPMSCWKLSLAKTNVKNYCIPQYFLSVFEPFKILIFLFSNLHKLKTKDLLFEDEQLDGLVDNILKKSILTQSTFLALLNVQIYKNISKRFNAEKFILPYEGLCWETASILGFRQSSPEALITGKQHAVISTAAINNFPINSQYMPLPDIIESTGTIPLKVMLKFNENNKINFRKGAAYRFNFNSLNKNKKKQFNKTILLGLEGVSNCRELVEYALNQVKLKKDWTLIIRPHPILPFSKLLHSLNENPLNYKNVILSEGNSLEYDFNRSGYMLYWGTTVALDCIGYGIPLLHYKYKDTLSFDPLESFNHFKWNVDNSTDLITLCDQITNMPNIDLLQEKALSYLRDYFTQPDSFYASQLISN